MTILQIEERETIHCAQGGILFYPDFFLWFPRRLRSGGKLDSLSFILASFSHGQPYGDAGDLQEMDT